MEHGDEVKLSRLKPQGYRFNGYENKALSERFKGENEGEESK